MTSPHDQVVQLLDAFGSPHASAAESLCDRHPPEAVAFTVVEADLTARDVTFGELADASARVAAALADLGVGRGDRVATLMGKSAELVVAILAIWRLGAVQVPLFTAFAPASVAARISANGTKVVVCDPAQRAKLDAVPVVADGAVRVVTTGVASGDDLEFTDLLRSRPLREPVAVGGRGALIELFTSGTTGAPKAVPVPLRAVASMRIYQEYGLEHRASDVFWNAADPGWAYGLYYAIIGPLALGHRALLLRGSFSPELTWSVLAEFGVTNFAAAPTVYRALRRAPVPDGLRLRCLSSAGEPLTRDVLEWATEVLGVPVLDHYGQTELGMVAANAWHPDLYADPRPGSMGRPLPGWRLDVLRSDADEPARDGEPGRLAVDVEGSPLMWFTGYGNAQAGAPGNRFASGGRWYLTGDTASRDADGRLSFGSRADDVILMAGYRIDPSEVESVLMEHGAVDEAAVVGVPDELRGEVLIACVVLRPGTRESDELVADLQRLVKTRYAAHAYPRRVHFVPRLPRTPSGKVQRFLLRREHGTAGSSSTTAKRSTS
ncbi:AMP-binding protein [Actinomadura sp. NPDC048394]|uniref:AMP-binding protein n=1 Tax=Actinomadura sp. NPDC048394 TaxID=3158223 RepID=UPI0033D73126